MAEVQLKAPKGVTGAGVAGVEYEVDKSGRVQVAVIHVKALLEHGFTEIAAEDDAAPRARRSRGAAAEAGAEDDAAGGADAA